MFTTILLQSVIFKGVLGDIQTYYDIDDTLAGVISTTFVISYMCLSPLFGFLGDRYNRRAIMSVGIFVWSSVTLGSSFIGKNVSEDADEEIHFHFFSLILTFNHKCC